MCFHARTHTGLRPKRERLVSFQDAEYHSSKLRRSVEHRVIVLMCTRIPAYIVHFGGNIILLEVQDANAVLEWLDIPETSAAVAGFTLGSSCRHDF